MPEVASALFQAQARHIDALAFVLLDGRRSVRNRIAHYDAVPAGCINFTARGFFLAGGGEELNLPISEATGTITATLLNRIEHLHACVDDLIDSFVEAARA